MEDKAKESIENPRPLNGPVEENLEQVDGNNIVEGNPKKVRGRPLGSVGKAKKLKALALEGGEEAITAFGPEYNPVVVTVEPGEDLVRNVFPLGKKGPKVCILTATGTISKVHLFDDLSKKIIEYEGTFEILYVKGSNVSPFEMHIANGGVVHKGYVCGPVFAAEKIQVVAGKGTKRKCKANKLSEHQCGSQEHNPIEANSEISGFLCESEEQYQNSELPEFV